MSAILKARWPDANGIDFIPYKWFAKLGNLNNVSHEITDPRGGRRSLLRCNVTISENQAHLYYGGIHEEYNNQNRIDIGTTRITFHDGSRNGVCNVEWNPDGQDEFVPFDNFEIQIPDVPEEQENGIPETYIGKILIYRRNQDIIRDALVNANGICGDCRNSAPFQKANTDEPYLEVHHIVPLAQGGRDTMDNVIALCPNCHRQRHYG